MVLHTGNYISLCAGIGGLDLGAKIALPGSRCVCYVERESFAAAVLVARMEDEALDKAPVWSDITNFDCEPWRGSVDFVVAGFPCQPVSVAGLRKGKEDARWLWDDVIRVVRELGCRYVFLENVAGILSMGIGRVLGDLAESGFDAEFLCLRASSLDAGHKRDRWFCLAYTPDVGNTHDAGLEGRGEHGGASQRVARETGDTLVSPISSNAQRWGELAEEEASPCGQTEGRGNQGMAAVDDPSKSLFPPLPGSDRSRHSPEEAQPALRGVAHGTSERLDRLRALGNGCIPLQFAVAIRELIRRLR